MEETIIITKEVITEIQIIVIQKKEKVIVTTIQMMVIEDNTMILIVIMVEDLTKDIIEEDIREILLEIIPMIDQEEVHMEILQEV